jgi:hypothetical protein
MKKWGLLIGLFIAGLYANGQSVSGTIVTRVINSTYLQNTGGENPNRRISVYLPPGLRAIFSTVSCYLLSAWLS